MTSRSEIDHWHRRLAAIVGSMSLCLSRGRINLTEVKRWEDHLKAISLEMEIFQRVKKQERTIRN